MERYEKRRVGRMILSGIGVYFIVLGIIFETSAIKLGFRLHQRVPMSVFVLGGARELVAGAIVVFCAFRCRLTRAGVVSAIIGFVLLALVSISLSVFGQLTIWTVLRTIGYIALVVLGVLYARRVSK
jgi:hypothetical protein